MLPNRVPDQVKNQRIIIPQTKFHPDQLEDMEEEMAPHQKLHMTEFSSNNAGLIKDSYNNYYCAICARLILVLQNPLQEYPVRSTDSAICIDQKQKIFKHWMIEHGKRHIRRQNRMETQYMWACECGAIMGYQCCSYDDSKQLEKIKDIDEEEEIWNQFHPENKLILYVYQDSLVLDMVFLQANYQI